jgi:hypothetical protein
MNLTHSRYEQILTSLVYYFQILFIVSDLNARE